MADFVVGLRGGIGTGKSTVSELFADAGIVVADADISARTVVEPGKPAYQAIVERFGESVLQKDGMLDRPVLRELVFSNNEHRLFVEKQTHRPIIEDLVNITSNADSDYAILVLSTGIGRNPLMHRLLVVDAPLEHQISRVMQRDNNTHDQVAAILRAQPDRETRMTDADDVIVNDGEQHHLALEVQKLHQLYLALSRGRI
ncbi:MAG: dephospho-CoA kinase [Gammaproteobacteria bacterium]|nr:dephospho-CoA kinase [Gammaproteobacteria bacterium]MBT7878362.1 dephospho-CoA kinase [Gammaproteobacteria bacterium]